MPTKFSNWKMSVEMDYLSMYIKTWFAFLASAKELYPEAISTKGDGVLIAKYKESISIPKNFDDLIRPYIEEVFLLGNEIIKRDFPDSYFGYFYVLNKSFTIFKELELSTSQTIEGEKIKDKSSVRLTCKDKIGKSQAQNIHIEFKSTAKRFFKNFGCYHLGCNLLIQDLIKDELYKERDKTVSMIQQKMIETAHNKICDIHNLSASEIEERKGYANGVIITLIQNIRPDFKSEFLFQPQPLKDFPYNYDKDLNKLKVLQWFIQFNYSLRNIMFHHVIDPFDEQWLKLFRYAYLALQEVVNHNIENIENSFIL